MTIRYVWANSAQDDSDSTWNSSTVAYLTLKAAIAACAANDVIYVEVTHNESPATDSDVAYALPANISIYCVNKATSNSLTTMDGSTNKVWSGAFSSAWSGAYTAYVYGLAFVVTGGNLDVFTLSSTEKQVMVFEQCYFELGTSASSYITFSSNSSGVQETFVRVRKSTIKHNNAGQTWRINGFVELVDTNLTGTGPTTLIGTLSKTAIIDMLGCDISAASGTIMGDQFAGGVIMTLRQCRLGASTILGSQTTAPHLGGAHVYIYDSYNDSGVLGFGYYNALGYVEQNRVYAASDGATYNTSGSLVSWKIVGTSNCSFNNPFITPWLSVHHEGTGAITPYVEVLRWGSATAYDDDELWGELMYKDTVNQALGTIVKDRAEPLATPAAQTTGMGKTSWNKTDTTVAVDAGDTAWSGKLGPASSISPSETGDLAFRIAFAVADTVYVDPTIRGRS